MLSRSELVVHGAMLGDLGEGLGLDNKAPYKEDIMAFDLPDCHEIWYFPRFVRHSLQFMLSGNHTEPLE